MHTLHVLTDDHDMRLDRFLRQRGHLYPQSLMEKWSRKKALLVNGMRAKLSHRVQAHDVVTFPDHIAPMEPPKVVTPTVYSPTEAQTLLNPMIISDHGDILALNKPVGIATQGGTGQKTSIDAILHAYSPNARYKLTHRLDKETSGVLLVAKTSAMARQLTQGFRDRHIHKTYLALCAGHLKAYDGVIDRPLALCHTHEASELRSKAPLKKEVSAVTHYEVQAHGYLHDQGETTPVTLVALHPRTGRMHQLRIHMAYLGYPILGDRKYGGPVYTRMMLHAWKIAWADDMHASSFSFEAPVPALFSCYVTS